MGYKKRFTTEMFVERARAVHKDKYDYSKSVYILNSEKVIIICPTHGEFLQTPSMHYSKNRPRGCPLCGLDKNRKTLTMEDSELQKRLKNKFNGNIELRQKLKGVTTYLSKCVFYCHTHKKEFTKTMRSALRSKHGCNDCSVEARAETKRNDINTLKQELDNIYGDSLSFPYLDTEYTNNQSKITVICKAHPSPHQNTYSALRIGLKGCPECKSELTSERLSMSFDEFKDKAHRKYNNKYTYSQESWIGRDKESREGGYIEIVCPEHGVFSQHWKDHIGGCLVGCPSCANSDSAGQKELFEYIKELFPFDEIKYNTKKYLDGLEMDIFIPHKNIGIEYNGNYWHSYPRKPKKYHLDKRLKCADKGIRLINIWEDEWTLNKEKVKKYLLSQLIPSSTKNIMARKCSLVKVDFAQAKKILEENHLLSYGIKCQEYIGLEHEGKLVSLVGFKKSINKGKYELQRAVTIQGVRVLGGFSKIVNHWRKENPDSDLISYVDMDKFDGHSYKIAGFTDRKLNLTMWYFYKGKRESKYKFRKSKLDKVIPDYNPNETELTNCLRNNIYPIWNSGTKTVYLPSLNSSK